jgi:nucleoid-associated protein YgaU
MPTRYSKYLHIQPIRKISIAITDITHTLQHFETLDQIALKYYNDPTLEWVIMCANPDQSLSFAITPGTQLRIPFPLERVFREWGDNGEI